MLVPRDSLTSETWLYSQPTADSGHQIHVTTWAQALDSPGITLFRKLIVFSVLALRDSEPPPASASP
jgi:hypothetical protein